MATRKMHKVPARTNDAGVNPSGASVTVELKPPKAARRDKLNDWASDSKKSAKKKYARSMSST